jgi:hypothetical protein
MKELNLQGVFWPAALVGNLHARQSTPYARP